MRFDHSTNSALMARGTDYAVVTNNSGNLVKTGAGRCVKILVVAGTSTLAVYDGTTSGGTEVYAKTTVAVGDIYDLDCPVTTGIFVQPGASTTVTVIYA